MWTYQTHRIIGRSVAVVRDDIARLVDATWRSAVRVETTEHHGRRTDWIAGLGGEPRAVGGTDAVDVVLTWSLTDLDDATCVVLTLDELEPGPDPGDGLAMILDALVTAPVHP